MDYQFGQYKFYLCVLEFESIHSEHMNKYTQTHRCVQKDPGNSNNHLYIKFRDR